MLSSLRFRLLVASILESQTFESWCSRDARLRFCQRLLFLRSSSLSSRLLSSFCSQKCDWSTSRDSLLLRRFFLLLRLWLRSRTSCLWRFRWARRVTSRLWRLVNYTMNEHTNKQLTYDNVYETTLIMCSLRSSSRDERRSRLFNLFKTHNEMSTLLDNQARVLDEFFALDSKTFAIVDSSHDHSFVDFWRRSTSTQFERCSRAMKRYVFSYFFEC